MKNALIALARENKAFIKTSKIYTFFISAIQVLVIESRLFLDYKNALMEAKSSLKGYENEAVFILCEYLKR